MLETPTPCRLLHPCLHLLGRVPVRAERVCTLPGGVGYIFERRCGRSFKVTLPLPLPLTSNELQVLPAAALSARKEAARRGTGSSGKGGAARRWAWQRVPLALGLVRRRQRFIDGRDVLYITLSEVSTCRSC